MKVLIIFFVTVQKIDRTITFSTKKKKNKQMQQSRGAL